MQTVETTNEGLKRAYKLTVTAADVEARVDAEVKKIAPQVQMPGFRPGKVPANLVKKMHKDSLLQEALNNSIQEGVQHSRTCIWMKIMNPAKMLWLISILKSCPKSRSHQPTV